MVAGLDYGFCSEMVTRFSMIISKHWSALEGDLFDLFSDPITDWYLVGIRIGMFWKILFDVELDAA